jgi:hypothetical protein
MKKSVINLTQSSIYKRVISQNVVENEKKVC